MRAFLVKADHMIDPLRKLADFAGKPVLLLAFRIHIATIFLASGYGRLKDLLNGNWDTQVFLFGMEHPVPGIPPEIAAFTTMGAELILPVLLLAGLFTRFSAAGLIVMTTVIEFIYQHPEIKMDICLFKTGIFSCIYRTDHIVWIAMLLTILVIGPGKLALDHLLRKWLKKH